MKAHHVALAALALAASSAFALADPGPQGSPTPDKPAAQSDGPSDRHGWGGGHRSFGPGGGFVARPWGPPHGLARILSAEETAIGIRSAQLDAWRDYTDALQAFLAPPDRRDRSPSGREAFALPQRLAADAVERGKAAEKLQASIDALKKVLTPEQLDRAAAFIPPRPGEGRWRHGSDGRRGPDGPPDGRDEGPAGGDRGPDGPGRL